MFERLIEPSCDNGFEDDEQFELTKKAKSELLSEVISNINGIQFKNIKDYIPVDSIVQKQLYFNDVVDKLIATTNLTENHDSAFERRFLFKVKFGYPDANARLHIWEDLIPEIKDIEDLDQIVESYAFSGGQIENIARKCRIDCILEGKNPDFGMLKTFCDEELLAKPRIQITGFQNKRHNDE